jgi:cytochrome c-type biogenesis protein CcmH
MVFWLVLALLTVIASLAVLLPLTRRGGETAAGGAHDLEVYRDQLAEIDRDAARGLIGGPEAAQARAEIGRRILKLAAPTTTPVAREASVFARGAAVAGVLAVPLVSWGLYVAVGSPDMPGQPLAARLAKDPAQSSVDELIARAEGHLRANPTDGRGWDVLAPIYLRAGRSAEAITAYRNAIRLLGSDAARETGLGEAIASAAGGVVTSDATQAFERALEHEPTYPRARFFIASGYAQEGRFDDAAESLHAMLADLPADSPWLPVVRQALASSEREAGTGAVEAKEETPRGPTREDVEAAGQMSADDRGAMIESMVAGLDARLRENPKDADGWTRLVRSYVVLGRMDDARDALGRGVAALGADGAQARDLVRLAESLGIEDVTQQ